MKAELKDQIIADVAKDVSDITTKVEAFTASIDSQAKAAHERLAVEMAVIATQQNNSMTQFVAAQKQALSESAKDAIEPAFEALTRSAEVHRKAMKGHGWQRVMLGLFVAVFSMAGGAAGVVLLDQVINKDMLDYYDFGKATNKYWDEIPKKVQAKIQAARR